MITLINHQGLKVIKGVQIQTPVPPLGLAYIGAFLKQNGYSYTAVDACGEALGQVVPSEMDNQILMQGLTIPQILERIPSHSRIFGFTCTFSGCWPLVTEVATAIRSKFRDALFIAGGEHPTALPEQVLKNKLFDVVVCGEGEKTFLELIKKAERNQPWHEIDGIAYMSDENKIVNNKPRMRIKDIDSLPYPDWDSWYIDKYIEYEQVSGINLGKSIPFLGSRGCPYSCSFCSNEGMWAKRYIMRGAKNLVDEMEYMKDKYNLNGFSFFDLTFIVNHKQTLDFCRELIDRNLNITYQLPLGTRCEVFDDELVFALEKSGLRNFSFAPESGSEMILNVMRKNIKLDNIFKAIKSVKKTKMTIGCFIVLGVPEDTKESIKQTLSFVRKLALKGVHDVTVTKFTPYPGSIYFNQLREKGYFSDDFKELSNTINVFSDSNLSYNESLSAKQLHYWMNWVFINFYVISFIVRPWEVIKNFWDYFTKGVERTKYMRFFSEIFINRKKWKKSSL